MSATVMTASDTAYFDTVSLRLLRNDLALSVDNGSWCLATPDGPIRFAGTGLAVPPALARLVRAYTRDDDLVAVARVGDGGTTELHALLDHRIARSPRPLDDSARGVVLRYVRAQIAALAAADLAARRAAGRGASDAGGHPAAARRFFRLRPGAGRPETSQGTG